MIVKCGVSPVTACNPDMKPGSLTIIIEGLYNTNGSNPMLFQLNISNVLKFSVHKCTDHVLSVMSSNVLDFDSHCSEGYQTNWYFTQF